VKSDGTDRTRPPSTAQRALRATVGAHATQEDHTEQHLLGEPDQHTGREDGEEEIARHVAVLQAHAAHRQDHREQAGHIDDLDDRWRSSSWPPALHRRHTSPVRRAGEGGGGEGTVIEIIGVPYNSAGRPGGVALAPQVLREHGLVEPLPSQRVTDGGDVALSAAVPVRGRSGLLAEAALVEMVQAVRSRTGAALAAGRMPVVVGGDCPVLLGGLAGGRDQFAEIGLLFVDGHEDAWPPSLSTTGEAADCELGIALGRQIHHLPSALTDLLPLVEPAAVTAIGPRDTDELAAAGIASLADSLTVVRPAAVHEAHAAGRLAARVHDQVERICGLAGQWWFHLDLDVLATDQLAAVDYQQPGGLHWDELDLLTSAALGSPGCIGWTLTIYNPELDPTRVGAHRIVRHFRQALAVAAPADGQQPGKDRASP
jgi:arginase